MHSVFWCRNRFSRENPVTIDWAQKLEVGSARRPRESYTMTWLTASWNHQASVSSEEDSLSACSISSLQSWGGTEHISDSAVKGLFALWAAGRIHVDVCTEHKSASHADPAFNDICLKPIRAEPQSDHREKNVGRCCQVEIRSARIIG